MFEPSHKKYHLLPILSSKDISLTPYLKFPFLNVKAWDYSSWASEMIRTMAAEETIRDASTSGLKINQHQQLLPEIESRDEIYERVSQLGQELALEQKMATEEVYVYMIQFCNFAQSSDHQHFHKISLL